MENLGPEHFFPGIPWYEKRSLESETEWLVSSEANRGWRFEDDDENLLVSNEDVIKFEYEKPKYPDDIQQLQVVAEPIEKGKPFDVISLLSSKDKDGNYLVRNRSSTNNNNNNNNDNNNNEDDDRVEIESLRGKFIMLCCFSVPGYREGAHYNILQAISHASHELFDERKSEFEMVVVANMKEHWAHDKAAFDHFVSGFSCLVVPFHHPFRRDYICKSLNFQGFDRGLLVDPDQVVVQDNVSFLKWYGADAFPFTDERLRLYDRQTWKGKSLDQLLGSHQFLEKNNKADKVSVSVSVLKEKLVGLYLCVTGSCIPMLEKAYQRSQDREHGFEIVLVYLPFYLGTPPEVFQEVINRVLEKLSISWWVLPFSYSLCCRLSKLASYCISDQLVIVSPCGESELVDPCGGLVIKNFGMNAYPFTREGLVKAAFKTLERHSLESLLEGGFLSRGNSNGGDTNINISVADLRGRNILLYLGRANTLSYYQLLTELYDKIKAKNPDFEVVFICLNNLDNNQSLPPMPWLIFRPNPSKLKTVAEQLFISNFKRENLVAFDKDGQICSINAQHLLTCRGSAAFPFSGDLLGEILAELDASCGGRFMFGMAWSDSFMMDKRMASSAYGAKLLSPLKAYNKIRQTRAKRVPSMISGVGRKRHNHLQ